MSSTIKSKMEDRLRGRLSRIPWELVLPVGSYKLWVAGSCLLEGKPNDYDVFLPAGARALPLLASTDSLIHKSKNATTYLLDGRKVQFCSYSKPTLLELIGSFDYAHVQVGAVVNLTVGNLVSVVHMEGIEYTDSFKEARIFGSSRYVGSEYPLSSLMRLCKYKERGLLPNWRRDMFTILKDVVTRGFKDYKDFKDQLDAVDLAYSVDNAEALELFEALRRSKG